MKKSSAQVIKKYKILFQIVSALVASAAALPLEDTAEVKAAKATFKAAFDQAEKGEHASLAPSAVANSYLDDAEDVALAKADFAKAFEAAEKGEVPLPVAPEVPEVPAVYTAATIPAAAIPAFGYAHPYAYSGYAAPYYNGFYGYNAGLFHPGYYGYNNAYYVAAPAKVDEA